jgi:nucleoside phosphorylase
MSAAVDCDILIFFATHSEAKALREAAKGLGISFKLDPAHPRLGQFARLGRLGSFEVVAVETGIGPLQFGGSASRGIIAQSSTGATAIVQIGMAFGVDRDTQQIGDVLVSTEIIPYDRRQVRRDLEGNRPYLVDYSLAGRFPAKKGMIELFQNEAERTQGFQVLFGALLSGGARIFSAAFREELVAGVPAGDEPVIGGEMEGAGLLSVSPVDDPIWIVVKGISDFADEQRDTEIKRTRPIACINAARFVLSAIINVGNQAINVMEAGDG